MFGTSYQEYRLKETLRAVVWASNPRVAIEFGTQQGYSASLIAGAMQRNSWFYTYDTFEKSYKVTPFMDTHANYDMAVSNLEAANLSCGWKILKESADNAKYNHADVDLLHIDIDNHYDNLAPILKDWVFRVNKMIVLEGGVYNSWQRKHHLKYFVPFLKKPLIARNFEWITIVGERNKDHAITILRKKYRKGI